MKRFYLLSVALAIAGFGPGCANLDLARESNPDRVINGMVLPRGTVPAGAEMAVRLLDLNPREAPKNPLSEMTTAAPRTIVPERVVAEKSFTVPAQTGGPIPFQLPYAATDAELRHGLNLEVRISHGGKVRFRSVSAHVVTLGSAPYQHEVHAEMLP